MRCEGCGAEVMLGSAHCGNCGRSLLGAASAAPAAPVTASDPYSAPPPPPPGWTLADGPARQALLPPPPTRVTLSGALRPPTAKRGCGCGALVLVGVGVVVAAVIAIVVAAIDTVQGETIDGPSLALGDTVRFEIGSNDTGRHTLALGEGAVTITVRGVDDTFDPVLEVRQPDGTLIGSNDDALGTDSQLSFSLPGAADFVVEVHEFGHDAGEYEVEVSSGATGPVLDPTDVVAGERIPAGALFVDEPLTRNLGTDDTAVHSLVGFEPQSEADRIVSISVVGIDGFDPVLRVVDEDGSEIGENDDADGLNSLLSFEIDPGDRFDVEVREFSGDAGFYTIRLQRGDGIQTALPSAP